MSVEVEISHENISTGSYPNVNEELNSEPYIGMEFKTVEKVREFYNSFAKRLGFGVRVRSTKPKRAILVCCNEGQHMMKSSRNKEIQYDTNQAKRKCSTQRSGCQASLIVSRGTTEGNWIICSFNNDHNHDMVSPRSVSYMRCHKRMSTAAKSLVEQFSGYVKLFKHGVDYLMNLSLLL
ncbi:protein FAR1-RELATED SEQUENCE 5-like [Trifolium pratense]|uniref:protein FAR1-RELATED SEQUENCE 5-like n=1 Tax=Trifolium pratense TaxID=57577 RepID=UPI001E695897|nr:protein FAR1-RELATED SEQUENCE 5-like [Trifolium pratense]